MRELENEVEMLKNQANSGNSGPKMSAAPSQNRDADLRDIKNDLSKDEQIKIQKELAQLDMIVKGYMDENQKAMKKLNEAQDRLKSEVRDKNKMEVELKELRLKALKEQKGVYVEEKSDEVNIGISNVMGNSQSISLKQLQELRDTLRRLQIENDDFRTQLEKKATMVRSSVNEGLKDEKSTLESKMINLEY